MNVHVNAHGAGSAAGSMVAPRPGFAGQDGVVIVRRDDFSLLVDSEEALRAGGCQIVRHA